MTEADPGSGRVLAEAVRDLPPGLSAHPTGPSDVDGVTGLVQAVDIAGCGHSSSNAEEMRHTLAMSDCGWGRGSAVVRRGDEVVAALFVFDGLAAGLGWMVDVYARPGDPEAHRITGALIDAGLREGRARFDRGFPDAPTPEAKAGAYANDSVLRTELEQRGFAEVRRFWRMSTAPAAQERQDAGRQPSGASRAAEAAKASAAALAQRGYTLRPFQEVDWRGMHEAHSTAFLDHFDFTPVDFTTWRERCTGQTDDITQWLVVEHEDRIVAYAQGSNRYATEHSGYVASIGVLREHRGRGLARALLHARIADDAQRGFTRTILHVDATNPTGATALYESVGFVADSEFVGFHRPLRD